MARRLGALIASAALLAASTLIITAHATGADPQASSELPAASAPPKGPTPVPLTGILAVAYTDLNKDHAFDTGDVMIAQLEDTNGDKVPSVGDTVRMGRYPKTLTPSAPADFGTWGRTTHTVASVLYTEADFVGINADDGIHSWFRTGGANVDEYREVSPGPTSAFADSHSSTFQLDPLSPSAPADTVPLTLGPGTGDDYFIDVELNYTVP